jgi:hypothetical protein
VREKHLYVFFWVVAVLALGAVGIGLTFGWSEGRRSSPTARADATDGTLTILWLGDTMLGDASLDSLAKYGYAWPFEHVAEKIGGDFVVVNAEAPLTTLTEPWDPSQHWHYNVDPEAARVMADIGIDALGLANNHAMDRGPEGLQQTRMYADQASMVTFGAGATEAEAERPLFIESPLGTVAVVALGKYYGRTKMARRDHAGTIALSRASIRRGHRLARMGGADWVVGFVHWGAAYADVNEDQRRYARMFAEEGYDLLVGHHPHVTQPVEIIGSMPVAYSLGNFVFGAPGRFGAFGHPGIGLMLASHFTDQGIERITLRCIVTDNRIVGFQPRPCSPEETRSLLPPLHPNLVIQGDSALLSIRDLPLDLPSPVAAGRGSATP